MPWSPFAHSSKNIEPGECGVPKAIIDCWLGMRNSTGEIEMGRNFSNSKGEGLVRAAAGLSCAG